MKLSHHRYEPGYSQTLPLFPKSMTVLNTLCVEEQSGRGPHFVLLKFPYGKDHVCCSSVFPESTHFLAEVKPGQDRNSVNSIGFLTEPFPAVDKKEMPLWFLLT